MKVARIQVYPVKSLDGQPVESARLLPSGALEHDRAYALHDETGAVVNAKAHPALHRLRSHVDLAANCFDLRDQDGEAATASRFHLERERPQLEARLGVALAFPVALAENRATGFPDDLASPGPTIISTATVAAVAEWFGLSLDDVRARLRANIEIDGVPPFWEDRLFGPGEATVPFAVGDQVLSGVNPCQRCAVPTRDPRTGRADPSFARRFMERRRNSLPPWASRGSFDHFFRVAVNTRIAPGAQPATLRVGDRVRVGSEAL